MCRLAVGSERFFYRVFDDFRCRGLLGRGFFRFRGFGRGCFGSGDGGRGDLKFRRCLDQFGEFGPAFGALKLENAEVGADQFRVVLLEQVGDGRLQFLGVEIVRNIFGGSFAVVLDPEAVKESGEKRTEIRRSWTTPSPGTGWPRWR